jgi:hypothetical protein
MKCKAIIRSNAGSFGDRQKAEIKKAGGQKLGRSRIITMSQVHRLHPHRRCPSLRMSLHRSTLTPKNTHQPFHNQPPIKPLPNSASLQMLASKPIGDEAPLVRIRWNGLSALLTHTRRTSLWARHSPNCHVSLPRWSTRDSIPLQRPDGPFPPR